MSGTSEVRFRRATLDDVAAIVGLIADDRLGRSRDDASLPLRQAYVEAFRTIDADPNQLLAVADLGGEVVGCLQLTFIPGLSRGGMWRGQVEAVRIAASRRGSGLGKSMLRWAIEECRTRGCGLVQLTADKSRKDAHRFYESLGFIASHEGMKRAIDL